MADLEASEDFVRYEDDGCDAWSDYYDDVDEDREYCGYDDQDAFMEASNMDDDGDDVVDDDYDHDHADPHGDPDTSAFPARYRERRLKSCGLLYFDDGNYDDDEDDPDGGRLFAEKRSRYFGADLTIRFSRALRLARLPSIAAMVLQDGVGLDMDWERRTLWSREVSHPTIDGWLGMCRTRNITPGEGKLETSFP